MSKMALIGVFIAYFAIEYIAWINLKAG
jgi:hypothetical protein